jgi:hypothetical protein
MTIYVPKSTSADKIAAIALANDGARIEPTTDYALSFRLMHACDGPVTPFVVMYRSMQHAAAGSDVELVANALAQALERLGVRVDDDVEFPADS